MELDNGSIQIKYIHICVCVHVCIHTFLDLVLLRHVSCIIIGMVSGWLLSIHPNFYFPTGAVDTHF